jgi:hypothetical protein
MTDIIKFPTKNVIKEKSECDESPVNPHPKDNKVDANTLLDVCNKTIREFSKLKENLENGTINQEIIDIMRVYCGYDILLEQDIPNREEERAKIRDVLNKSPKRERIIELVSNKDIFLSFESLFIIKTLDEQILDREEEVEEFVEDLLNNMEEVEEPEDESLCKSFLGDVCQELLEPVEEKVLKFKNQSYVDREDAQEALIETLGDLLDEAKSNKLNRLMYIKGDIEGAQKLEYGICGRWFSLLEMSDATRKLKRKVELYIDTIEEEEYED